jgi:hypothetical protein
MLKTMGLKQLERSFRSEGGIPYKSWGKSYKKI